MTKLRRYAKSVLLGATMLALGITAVPQAAKAWVLTITCYGYNEHCATVFVDGWVIDIYLGNIVSIEFEA